MHPDTVSQTLTNTCTCTCTCTVSQTLTNTCTCTCTVSQTLTNTCTVSQTLTDTCKHMPRAETDTGPLEPLNSLSTALKPVSKVYVAIAAGSYRLLSQLLQQPRPDVPFLWPALLQSVQQAWCEGCHCLYINELVHPINAMISLH